MLIFSIAKLVILLSNIWECRSARWGAESSPVRPPASMPPPCTRAPRRAPAVAAVPPFARWSIARPLHSSTHACDVYPYPGTAPPSMALRQALAAACMLPGHPWHARLLLGMPELPLDPLPGLYKREEPLSSRTLKRPRRSSIAATEPDHHRDSTSGLPLPEPGPCRAPPYSVEAHRPLPPPSFPPQLIGDVDREPRSATIADATSLRSPHNRSQSTRGEPLIDLPLFPLSLSPVVPLPDFGRQRTPASPMAIVHSFLSFQGVMRKNKGTSFKSRIYD